MRKLRATYRGSAVYNWWRQATDPGSKAACSGQ